MKKIFILISICSLFLACTPFDVVDNKRILIKGRVENPSSEGIGDMLISVATNTTSGGYMMPGSTSTEILQDYHTKPDGTFYFNSFDIKEDPFLIIFNPNSSSTKGEYQKIVFYDARERRDDFLIDLGSFQVKKRIPLEIVFYNVSGTNEDVSASLEYYLPEVVIPIDSWSNLSTNEMIQDHMELNDYYFDFNEEESYSRQLDVLEDTSVTLSYSVGGDQPTEIIIPILDEPITHEIAY